MKIFDVFLHSEKGVKAIKRGFSWPAFFVGPIWAFVNGLIGVGIILVIFGAIVSISATMISFGVAMNAGEILGGLAGLGIGIGAASLVGSVGNSCIRNRFFKKGYILSKTVSARNYKEAITSSHLADETIDGKISRSQKKLMPIEEYAKQNNLDEDSVVQMVKNGDLVGKVDGGKWFVDLVLSSQKESISIVKDISKEKGKYTGEKNIFLRWTLVIVGVVLLGVFTIIIMQMYAQHALQQRVRDASIYLNNESQESVEYEPYYLSADNVTKEEPFQKEELEKSEEYEPYYLSFDNSVSKEKMDQRAVLEDLVNEQEVEAVKEKSCEDDCQQMYDSGDLRSGVTVDECVQKVCR